MKKTNLSLKEELEKSFARWQNVHDNGGSCPYSTDGQSLNLVRNHILSYKNAIANSQGIKPEIYYRETPPIMDEAYMVNSNQIRASCKEAFEICIQDKNFIFLEKSAYLLPDSIQKKNNIHWAINRMKSWKASIENDNLVEIRRLMDSAYYLKSFKEIADQIRPMILNDGILTDTQGQVILF